MFKAVTSINIIIFACTIAFNTTATLAQEVELSTDDGSLNLRGQLIEFVDQKYTIDTSIGRMTVDSNNVLCSGEACPSVNLPTSNFRIVSLDTLTTNIMPDILTAYAQSIDAQMSITDDDSFVFTNGEGEELAIISLSSTSSSDDSPSLRSVQPVMALTSGPLRPEEALELINFEQQTGQSTDTSKVIGLNAITIITAKDNPISAMSTSDIAKVFSGEYKNWSDLGGQDAPIALYGPQPDSELAKTFEIQIFGARDDDKSHLSQDIFYFENIAERVAFNPNGIGYTYFANFQPAQTLDIQEACGMAIPANNFTIKAEEYPLTQRVYTYRLTQTNIEHADRLSDFMQSDTAQEIISSHGLINQRDTSYAIKNQGIRFVNAIAANTNVAGSELLRQMIMQINGSKRLSMTFRFETGSDQMDQRAQTDIVRLAEKLKSPENDGRVVHLMGFTDSAGDFDLNLEVSLRRANQVRDALIGIDTSLAERVSILPAGFGEIAPVACNESDQGRTINQRVEVWTD